MKVRPPQNHAKFGKSENQEKRRKNEGNINFLMFQMHFRSADAANHLNALRGPASALNDLLRQQKDISFFKLKDTDVWASTYDVAKCMP